MQRRLFWSAHAVPFVLLIVALLAAIAPAHVSAHIDREASVAFDSVFSEGATANYDLASLLALDEPAAEYPPHSTFSLPSALRLQDELGHDKLVPLSRCCINLHTSTVDAFQHHHHGKGPQGHISPEASLSIREGKARAEAIRCRNAVGHIDHIFSRIQSATDSNQQLGEDRIEMFETQWMRI